MKNPEKYVEKRTGKGHGVQPNIASIFVLLYRKKMADITPLLMNYQFTGLPNKLRRQEHI